MSNPALDGAGEGLESVLESSSAVPHGSDDTWAKQSERAWPVRGSIPHYAGFCQEEATLLPTRHRPTSGQPVTGRAHIPSVVTAGRTP